jgi:hypothetical protein
MREREGEGGRELRPSTTLHVHHVTSISRTFHHDRQGRQCGTWQVSNVPQLVLTRVDYGVSIAGVHFFDILSCDEDAEVEVTLSEVRSYLDRRGGDGPIPFLARPAVSRRASVRNPR